MRKMHDNIRLYHVDHLGSTSLVTDIDGEITQHVAYIPYGEVFVEQRNGSWNTPYLFNAKELDEETGLYYYGARYLDPTHAAWLSVDPMFEKYVGMTPYNYCAGNPVKLVDVDGENYSLNIDNESAIITISATYYTTNQDAESAQKAADYWNNQSDKFIYRAKNKKDKSETKDYTIKFDMKVVSTGDANDYNKKRSLIFPKMNADKGKSSNAYFVRSDDDLDADVNGRTIGGSLIEVKESKKNTDTGAHEVGHSLGLDHSFSGLMTPGDNDPDRSQEINTSDIIRIIEGPLKESTKHKNRGKLTPNSYRIDLKKFKGNVIQK
jgi:RHS repeat-associated protein